MNTFYDRLRRGVLRYQRRLQSIITDHRAKRSAHAEIKRVLMNWGIGEFRLQRNLGGASRSSWLVRVPGGTYVLRSDPWGRDYLNYQIAVMRHLSRSDFPYEVPSLIRPNELSDYVADGERCWLLYGFLEGVAGSPLSHPDRAKSVGELVAHYHRTIETLEPGGWSELAHLQLFEVEKVACVLREGARWMRTRPAPSNLKKTFLENVDAMLQVYGQIPASQIESVAELEKITVYNDWHQGNMVSRSGRICGLIDYDSVIQAPRIVDFQNALTYVLISKNDPDRDLIPAFCEGYRDVLPLSRREVSLIYPVMLDRLAWLIADIVDQIRRTGTNRRVWRGTRMIQLFSWLSVNGDRLTGDVMQHMRPR